MIAIPGLPAFNPKLETAIRYIRSFRIRPSFMTRRTF